AISYPSPYRETPTHRPRLLRTLRPTLRLRHFPIPPHLPTPPHPLPPLRLPVPQPTPPLPRVPLRQPTRLPPRQPKHQPRHLPAHQPPPEPLRPTPPPLLSCPGARRVRIKPASAAASSSWRIMATARS